jgi:hypothetical protein
MTDIKTLKKLIDEQYDANISKCLSDEALLDDFKLQKSYLNETKKLEFILEKHGVELETINKIIDDYCLTLIPAGTKGVIRGNKFNALVKTTINNINLDTSRFEVTFETMCEICDTSEKPDWYILDKNTGKVIIGMNQLDLWSGGAQSNRASKYVTDCKYNTENVKLLAVVANKAEIKSSKNKIYNLFKIGFDNKTLCYTKNLEYLIKDFFRI